MEIYIMTALLFVCMMSVILPIRNFIERKRIEIRHGRYLE